IREGVLNALSGADATIRAARDRTLTPARQRACVLAAGLLDKAIELLETAGPRFDSRNSVLRRLVVARAELLSDPSFALLAGAAPSLVLELARARYPNLALPRSPANAMANDPMALQSAAAKAKPGRGGPRVRVARAEMDDELRAAGVTARARRLLL